ncbi:MAG: hypothetical protein R2834_07480 [Rhodothermales bacterium]
MKRSRNVTLFVLLILLALCIPSQATRAQGSIKTRFGIGMNMAMSVDNGFGLGFRGRVSSPINSDFSLAIGMGFTGFVLRGRDDASFVFDPQVSGIINLPSTTPDAEIYLLAGLGAYVPLSQNTSSNESGPSIHFGIGRVQLLQESSFFYEINPAVIVGQTAVQFILPFRVGLIFGN